MRAANDRSARDFFESKGYDQIDTNEEFKTSKRTDEMIWDQLLSGGNMLRKRIALALSEFFVVSASPLDMKWAAQAMGAYWDVLNEHAFGNFRSLLHSIALNPAMGSFLDTIGNKKEDPASGRVPDENFAREIMQLFSIGLYELNLDGSFVTKNGQPVETYTNEDVQGLARVFTGFDLDASGLESFSDPGRSVGVIFEAEIVRRQLTPIPTKWPKPGHENEHSTEEKRFLDTVIPPGTGPIESVYLAVEALSKHPNVGPFFGKQMIQRLVTSNPSPGYVSRVAAVFNDNGKGVRGDLAAVFSAILLDEEANSDATLDDYRFGKLREPMLRFVQFARTFNLAKGGQSGVIRSFSDSENLLGQSPLRSPSVFNFFRPGYIPARSVTQANGMVGPELQLVNEISVAAYVNFMVRTIEGNGYWLNDLAPDYSSFTGLAHDSQKLLDELDLILTAGQLRPFTREQITNALQSLSLQESSPEDLKIKAVQVAVMLIMTSTDYLVQK